MKEKGIQRKEERITHRDLGAGLSLFLLGMPLACVIPLQAELLLYPCLLSPGLVTLALFGGLLGLGLGVVLGHHFAARGYALPTAAALTALAPALTLGALGILTWGYTDFLLWGMDRQAAPSTLSLFFSMKLIACVMPIPCMLGFSASLGHEQAYGERRGTMAMISLWLGCGTGALLFPWLLYGYLGSASLLQAAALSAGLGGLLSCSLSRKLRSPDSQGQRSTGNRASLSEALLFGFGMALLFGLVADLVRNRLGLGYMTGSIPAGLVFCGLGTALWIGRGAHPLPALTRPAIMLWFMAALPLISPEASTGMTANLGKGAWLCIPLGLLAGWLNPPSLSRLLRTRPASLFMGMILAFMLHGPALKLWEAPWITAVMAALAFLTLDQLVKKKAEVKQRSRRHMGGSVLCGAALLASFIAGHEFWHPQPLASPAPGSTAKRIASMTSLFHPSPETVLVLGPDSGLAVAELGRDPCVKEITWTHSHPQCTAAAQERYGERFDARPALSLQIHSLPERFFLARTVEQYDLIVRPPRPMERMIPVAHHTREYYEQVRNRMKEGGLFCQWIYPHEIDFHTFTKLATTLIRVFQELYIFIDHRGSLQPALALVGTDRRLAIFESNLNNRLSQTGNLPLFLSLGLGPQHFAVNFVTSGEGIRARLPTAVFEDRSQTFALPLRHGPGAANLTRILKFLHQHQDSSYPWFTLSTAPMHPPTQEWSRRNALILSQVGGLMQESTMHRIAATGLAPDKLISDPAPFDWQENLYLAGALDRMQDYRYLERLLLGRIQAMNKREKQIQALPFLEHCVRQYPECNALRMERVRVLAEFESYGKALQTLDEMPGPMGVSRDVILSRAILYARLGDPVRGADLLHALSSSAGPEEKDLPWIAAALEIIEGRALPEELRYSALQQKGIPLLLRNFVRQGSEAGL